MFVGVAGDEGGGVLEEIGAAAIEAATDEIAGGGEFGAGIALDVGLVRTYPLLSDWGGLCTTIFAEDGEEFFRNHRRRLHPGDCPEFAVHRDSLKSNLKIELRTLARTAPRERRIG